ncbi:hypothetical protein COV20_04890 [Candidatus Woesearchaeota archaeon CG10_big_fil_rev_8_21_14_0_10_45_16]|nr:MAG: hypothetical protein COV20_04890 [Candidatus Woesearchaeota archaeon CG10_big_fil_rev_8_21_14_0_10_45_16]
MKKRGQVTIFIILGIILLFIAIIFIQFSSSLKKQQLLSQQEELFGGLVTKEAARIFIQDCLNDPLEEGLKTLGQQGTLWEDQGGRDAFTENENGITYQNVPTFYAIRQSSSSEYPEAFPCQTADDPPAFCQYRYPQEASFGTAYLTLRNIQANLQRYVSREVLECVSKFTEEEISEEAELLTEQIEVDVSMDFNGLDIKADFPLEFSLSGENYFQLTNFEFFYETDFPRFMRAAVLNPIIWDSRYVDYDYSQGNLEQPTFSFAAPEANPNLVCREENNLQICDFPTMEGYDEMNIQLVKAKDDETGDEIFTFTAPDVYPFGEYSYRFARQDRPPALDYISRKECPAKFDYLVVPGDNSDLNILFISPKAHDADEDKPIGDGPESQITYSFEQGTKKLFPSRDIQDFVFPSTSDIPELEIKNDALPSVEPGLYNIIVTASDGKKEDKQDVRIFIDRPLDIDLNVDTGYTIKDENGNLISYSGYFSGREYWVSTEDPFLVSVKTPASSQTGLLDDPTITLSYSGRESFVEEPVTLGRTSNDVVYAYPWKQQSLGSYNTNIGGKPLIEVWKEQLQSRQDSSIFNQIDTIGGQLSLNYEASYCEEAKQETAVQKTLKVVGCIPHVNTEGHNFPYPFQNFVEVENDNQPNSIKEGDSINPFLATHACCDAATWTPLPAGTTCFTSPEDISCGGKSPELIDISEPAGYLEESRSVVYACDGVRGNTCLNQKEAETNLINPGFCADITTDPNLATSCSKVAVQCSGQPQWTLNKEEGWWCAGPLGCGNNREVSTLIVARNNPGYNFANLPENPDNRQFDSACTSNNQGSACLDLELGEGHCVKPFGRSARCEITGDQG